MRRREFLGALVGAVAMPLAARAQQPAMPVIGFLSGRSLASDSDVVAAFHRALNEAGYVNGQNVAIEFRWADGQLDRLPELAADLVERKVAVIFAGASDITNALWPKRLELLRELIAPTPLIAFLVNSNNLNHTPAMRELNAVARRIGQDVMVLNANAEGDFEAAFATLLEKRAGALVVSDDALFMNSRAVLAALAVRHAVPAIFGRREFIAAGGLMSYGASTVDQYYQSGVYVGRILKGAKPADLPFLQPTKFELGINLKTAKALGLTVPPTLIARADEVIE
jgi:putative ABC transport system substrate-binding protein